MKPIMFQGTASSVGKSAIAAAVCRVLCQSGRRVAPFKSQNMSRQVHTLPGGEVIAISQLVQAQACRIEPRWQMNPVLLKPVAEAGSEVFLRGRSQGRMSAREYYQSKPHFREVVRAAFEELALAYDIIVVEGAGSAAEINFRNDDFVNMGLAQMLSAPVVLIADIDRGGVFASIYGTVKLLSPEDQALIKGFIINKFRGDVSLLAPTVEQFATDLGIPCLGIVPYFEHNLPEEDSLTTPKLLKDQSTEQALDAWADQLRRYVDLPALYEIIGLV